MLSYTTLGEDLEVEIIWYMLGPMIFMNWIADALSSIKKFEPSICMNLV